MTFCRNGSGVLPNRVLIVASFEPWVWNRKWNMKRSIEMGFNRFSRKIYLCKRQKREIEITVACKHRVTHGDSLSRWYLKAIFFRSFANNHWIRECVIDGNLNSKLFKAKINAKLIRPDAFLVSFSEKRISSGPASNLFFSILLRVFVGFIGVRSRTNEKFCSQCVRAFKMGNFLFCFRFHLFFYLLWVGMCICACR